MENRYAVHPEQVKRFTTEDFVVIFIFLRCLSVVN